MTVQKLSRKRSARKKAKKAPRGESRREGGERAAAVNLSDSLNQLVSASKLPPFEDERVQLDTESLSREQKKLLAAVSSHPDAEWTKWGFRSTREMLDILKENRKGRPRKEDTAKLIELAAQGRAEGLNLYQIAVRKFGIPYNTPEFSKMRQRLTYYSKAIDAGAEVIRKQRIEKAKDV